MSFGIHLLNWEHSYLEKKMAEVKRLLTPETLTLTSPLERNPDMTTNLLNTEQTTMTIGYALQGVAVPTPESVAVSISIDNPILTATLQSDGVTIAIVPTDGAVGTANVSVTATLANGDGITSNEYFVITAPVVSSPDSVALTIGEIVAK